MKTIIIPVRYERQRGNALISVIDRAEWQSGWLLVIMMHFPAEPWTYIPRGLWETMKQVRGSGLPAYFDSYRTLMIRVRGDHRGGELAPDSPLWREMMEILSRALPEVGIGEEEVMPIAA